MAALTATSWVVTSSDVKTFREDPYRRVARMSLPTAGEYPSNGIPIPTANKFGLRVLRYIVPMGALATPSDVPDVIANYDNAFRSIRMFRVTTGATLDFVELATTVIPGSAALYVEVHGR